MSRCPYVYRSKHPHLHPCLCPYLYLHPFLYLCYLYIINATVYLHVCMHACMYVCMHIYIYIYIYTYPYTSPHVCMCLQTPSPSVCDAALSHGSSLQCPPSAPTDVYICFSEAASVPPKPSILNPKPSVPSPKP